MRRVAAVEYTQIRQIGVGQGKNSLVYLSHDPQLGGDIVVKEIRTTSFPRLALWFTEAQAMYAAATRNVVPIHWAGQTPNKSHVCIAMPYFSGGSLADRIASLPLSPVEAIRVFLRVLGGVAEIHVNGIIHYDIKPSNILFDGRDEPMIADFGQARRMGPAGTSRLPRMYNYGRPPEAFTEPAGTVLADVYQCGLSLYRAVNGAPAFDSQKMPIRTMPDLMAFGQLVRQGKFPDRQSFQPQVPRQLRTVIRKALNVDSAARYQSATEFVDALGQVACRHDWVMSAPAPGHQRWLSRRVGKADIIVDRVPVGARFSVEAHTVAKTRRRFNVSTHWAQGLTGRQASVHLKKVFDSLA